jgi:hypothetical protein
MERATAGGMMAEESASESGPEAETDAIGEILVTETEIEAGSAGIVERGPEIVIGIGTERETLIVGETEETAQIAGIGIGTGTVGRADAVVVGAGLSLGGAAAAAAAVQAT